MIIKRIILALLAMGMFYSIASCAGSSGVKSNLVGTPGEVLNKLIEDINATGVQMPMSLPPTEVSTEVSQNTIGLSEADFENYVGSASSSLAAIGTFAHQIVVIQANDAQAAAEVKKLISDDGGYDSQKWICVWPEQCAVVESGSYVLLIAANKDVVEAGIEVFRNAAGEIGEVNTFYQAE